MSTGKWIRTVVAVAIIGFGLLWSIMFPKTKDILRPDFVFSVALGLGLIVTGLLIFLMAKSRVLPIVLLILLLWSALFNISFYAKLRDMAHLTRHLLERSKRDANCYLRILESDEEDSVERLAELLRRVAGETRENQPTLDDVIETFRQKENQEVVNVNVANLYRGEEE